MNKAFFTIILSILAGIANAQMPQPAKWAFEYKPITNKEGELVFKATIDKGWHLFSQYNPPSKDGLGGAQPLSFTVIATDEYELVGKVEEPTYEKVYNDIWESDEYFFTDSAVFTQKIRLKTAKPFTISGKVAGQVCSEGICVPTDSDFSFKINP